MAYTAKPATKPEWATGAATLTTPSGAKIGTGWVAPEKPSDGIFNWQGYWTYQWINMLDQNYPTGYLLQARLTAGAGISLTNNGDNTMLITSTVTTSPSVAMDVALTAHGFVAKDAVRHNGTTWVKAQANSIAGCTDVWVVTAVADANTFTAAKAGRVTVAAHGLTPGTLYYLSADTAGLLTSTQPVGNTTRPLGYFLRAVYAVDATTLHILGQGPTFNPVYAEYTASGDVALSGLSFVISMSNIGYHLRGSLAAWTSNGSGGSLRIRVHNTTGVYNYTRWDDSSGTWTKTTASSVDYWELVQTANLADTTISAEFDLSRTNTNRWLMRSNALRTATAGGGPLIVQSAGNLATSSSPPSNPSLLSFTSSANLSLRAGDTLRLLIDKMPDA